jgi:hypothetical protein
MNELKPETQAMKQDLMCEAKVKLDHALQEARDDLNINQAKLTSTADEKIIFHAKLAQQTVEELKQDLCTQAETLEAEMTEKHTSYPDPTPPPTSRRNPPNTPDQEPPKNPYNRPPVSPFNPVEAPTEDQWNRSVSQFKEKVSLACPLLQDAAGLTETQAARQLESDVKGHPAVKIQEFDKLTRLGQSIPGDYAMGWPPHYVQEGSTMLNEKLRETTPHAMTIWQGTMTTHQSDRDGYRALMAAMKRSIARLGQLPPIMEPPWPKA